MFDLRLLGQGSEPNTEAIFRSETMTLVQFYVTIELARDVVFALGKLGNVHFRDLNSKLTPFQRTFVKELRNNDTVESKLKYLTSVMIKYGSMSDDVYLNLLADVAPLPSSSEMDNIKSKITAIHERIEHLDNSFNGLELQKIKLIENRFVITALNDFHKSSLLGYDDSTFSTLDEDRDDVALLNRRNHSLELGSESVNLGDAGFDSISGTILREKIPLLRNILWRTLRGNLFFHDIAIEPEKSILTETEYTTLSGKSIFIIYIHGDVLKMRVRKIIHSLDGIIFDNVEGGSEARLEVLGELNLKISDLESVVSSTKDHLIAELLLFRESFSNFCYIIQREGAIYETLNKFDEDSTRRCLVGEGWIPKNQFSLIRRTLKNLIKEKTRPSLPHTSDSQESIILSADEQSTPGSNASPPPTNHISSPFTIEDGESDAEDGSYDALIAVMNELSTNRTPPTYHKVNKFTSAFQLIIDAYGIATYQEVNPGLATVVTFPFMFAVMFGDLGHGFIVLLISLYLIKNEISFGAQRNKDEIFEMAFNGRYILLLMGIFSMYTGFMYNDIFSKSMTIFKSGWEWDFPKNYDPVTGGSITAKKIPGRTYLFGLDWAWHGAENNLLFTNSYKMKLSILMGFAHMNYSLFFSLVNYRYFKSKVDIIGNFIPGFLFMQSIFGYLCLTIIYKWSVDWLGTDRQPPGLLNMLINMFLAPGKIEEPLYAGQKFVQIILVLIAAICVPWLLLYKPMTLKKQNNKALELGYSDLHSQLNHNIQLHEEEEAIELENDLNHDPQDEVDLLNDDFRFPNDIEPLNHNSASHGDHEEFNFGDIVIHQVIHTIEFCLNCVSHTASYLRLWALSLAHAQLSSVLWSMTIQNAFYSLGTAGVVMTVLLFGLWFILTVCILVLMEGTSAMLHSLRLHWVEAMSKFFEGEGYAYEPFTFSSIEV